MTVLMIWLDLSLVIFAWMLWPAFRIPRRGPQPVMPVIIDHFSAGDRP
jgi:hypothetical protein